MNLSDLDTLFEKIERLPSVPTLYINLMELTQDANASFCDVAEVIQQDMAMTSMVLKIANSVGLGQSSRVVNAMQAAQVLGLNTLRSLVLSIGVFAEFKETSFNTLDINAIWKHSLEVAGAAKAIARLEKLSATECDEAYSAGLLHDIGKIVLADNFQSHYQTAARLIKEGSMDFIVEAELFGWSHAEVGGKILQNWKLPNNIWTSVYAHHTPELTGELQFSPLTAVHAANAICHGWQGEDIAQTGRLDSGYLEIIGMRERVAVWSKSVTNPEASELI
jgi:putative nucleotidyltransferase with HDIG domain